VNCGKIIYYNVGQCTCNSNKPKTVTRAFEIREHTASTVAANGMRKCRPGKRCHRRLFALARSPRYYYYYVSSWRVGFLSSGFAIFRSSCQRHVSPFAFGWSRGDESMVSWLFNYGCWKYLVPKKWRWNIWVVLVNENNTFVTRP